MVKRRHAAPTEFAAGTPGRECATPPSLLTPMRLTESAGSDTGVAGEELSEVGGFVEAEAAGDGRHRIVGVGEQALGLQGDAAVDDVLDGLPGGGGAGAGEGFDAAAEVLCVVGGAAGGGVPAFQFDR